MNMKKNFASPLLTCLQTTKAENLAPHAATRIETDIAGVDTRIIPAETAARMKGKSVGLEGKTRSGHTGREVKMKSGGAGRDQKMKERIVV